MSRAIAAALVAACPTGALAVACGTSSSGSSTIPGADATATDAALDVSSADAAPDAESVACQISVTTFDSGTYIDAGDGSVVDIGCIYNLPCGLPPTVVAIGCEVYTPDPQADAFYPLSCTVQEGMGCEDGSFTAVDGGLVGLVCNDCLGGGGRRPRGLRAAGERPGRASLGRYLARMAFEEDASIHAFARMRDELARHAAPPRLQREALVAQRDEERHARIMRRLAARHGERVTRARVRATKERSLEAMAIENAVEGCVNETYGAALLAWQAAHAPTAELRASFARIARDERRHAALSWAVDAWARATLDEAGRKRVARAKARAVRRLIDRTIHRKNEAFVASAGRPTRAVARAIAERLFASLDVVG